GDPELAARWRLAERPRSDSAGNMGARGLLSGGDDPELELLLSRARHFLDSHHGMPAGRRDLARQALSRRRGSFFSPTVRVLWFFHPSSSRRSTRRAARVPLRRA